MNVTVSMSATLVALSDGTVWTTSNVGYEFWTRYLDVFDQVRILARVQKRETISGDMVRVDGPQVSVIPLISYIGPREFLRRSLSVRSQILRSHIMDDAIMMRVPSTTAILAYPKLVKMGRPYGVEVVGDPIGVFASGASQHPLRRFFGKWFAWHQRRIISGASGVAYVTRYTLQSEYPPSERSFSTYFSSIDLPAEAFVDSPPSGSGEGDHLKCIFVGSLQFPYKGLDVLLDAIARCQDNGIPISLNVLGDGLERPTLEARANALGLADIVHFRGRVQGGATVRNFLDSSNLFILPSRTEGLPRAMIEAMARGLPCIGTAVGGIPELLSQDDLVPSGDADALAQAIKLVAQDARRRQDMAVRNLQTAQEYRLENLRARRVALYSHIREATSDWLSAKRKADTADANGS